MPELRHNTLAQHLMRIFDWASSNAAPLTVSDEDLSGEVDEPPDYQPQYCKQAVHKPVPHSSLLSQALSSPELGPVDRGRYGRQSQAISFWSLSGASTAELTSDGGMSSRSHSPSPPPPAMLHTYGRMLHSRKASCRNDTEAVHVVGEDAAVEGLARRRCIRFACGTEPPSRKSSTDDYPILAVTEQPQTTLKFEKTQPHQTSIRFAANIQTPQQERGSVVKSPSHTTSYMHAKTTPQPSLIPRALNPATRFHEFASSCEETESWMVQVPDKTRLLRVDGVLAKEKDIRKLSEEVEAEVRQEEDDDDEESLGDELAGWEEEDEDEDEDDEEDEDDNDDEEEEADEYMSGNESDNEEGFASDSDDDGSFFSYPCRAGYPLPLLQKPTFPHNAPPFSVGSLNISNQQIASINLPDSTDFVCGTFDEDKALEDAYVCALVEQKRAKYGITPQDIDPSFPSEESDSEEEYCIKSPGTPEHAWTRGRMSFSEEEAPRGKKIHSILSREKTINEAKIRFNSPAPQRRAHSPAPKRRIISPPPPTQRGFKVTPPISRRNSNEHSPRPALSRRCSRALSPPPPARNVSLNFTRRHIERTKSLPKGSKPSLRYFGANTQEFTVDETPAIRIRGAIDIVKGLEKKRERRRNKLARQRASYTRKGEGVEKMRELGLMLGRGKQAQWMISV